MKFLRLAILLVLSNCARFQSPREVAVSQQGAPTVRHGRITDHVIVISIDGLRADAIRKYKPATIQRLMREGRYSRTAQTIPTSLTLPSHTSMLTGVGSDVHGITWNTDRTKEKGYVAVPTVFSLAHESGFSTAAFFSKTKFNELEVPGTLDFARIPHSGVNSVFGQARTTGYVGDYFKHADPNLVFVHLMEPDFIGHQFGWMGYMYGMAVREADLGVAHLIKE